MPSVQRNGLEILAQRIRAIPEQQAISNFMDQIDTISSALASCKADLSESSTVAAVVKVLLERPEELDATILKRTKLVRRGATRIVAALQSKKSTPDRGETSPHIQDVRQGGKWAVEAVREHWKDYCSNHQAKYRQLIDIAHAYDPGAADRLGRRSSTRWTAWPRGIRPSSGLGPTWDVGSASPARPAQ